jgi:hypothetical protein
MIPSWRHCSTFPSCILDTCKDSAGVSRGCVVGRTVHRISDRLGVTGCVSIIIAQSASPYSSRVVVPKAVAVERQTQARSNVIFIWTRKKRSQLFVAWEVFV